VEGLVIPVVAAFVDGEVTAAVLTVVVGVSGMEDAVFPDVGLGVEVPATVLGACVEVTVVPD
jgi:hypothetical protein